MIITRFWKEFSFGKKYNTECVVCWIISIPICDVHSALSVSMLIINSLRFENVCSKSYCLIGTHGYSIDFQVMTLANYFRTLFFCCCMTKQIWDASRVWRECDGWIVCVCVCVSLSRIVNWPSHTRDIKMNWSVTKQYLWNTVGYCLSLPMFAGIELVDTTTLYWIGQKRKKDLRESWVRGVLWCLAGGGVRI